jgi:hypothetical protein
LPLLTGAKNFYAINKQPAGLSTKGKSGARTNVRRGCSLSEHSGKEFSVMADEKNTTQPQKSMGAAAGAQSAGTERQGDVKSQRGGTQADQISGETQKGAHNQEMKNKNPQGNKPNQNQSARQEGNTF